MKFIFLLVFVFTLGSQASINAQTVNFSKNNASLVEIFREIKKQTGYTIICDANILKNATPVSVSLRNTPLKSALKESLRSNDLDYYIDGESIVIREKTNANQMKISLPKIESEKSQQTVTGTVTGAQGPLAGVTVSVKGVSTQVTSTDANGKFSLQVPSGNGTLVFSMLGYIKNEIEVNSRSIINVTLKEEETAMTEVVVVGYGTQKKATVTGSIAQVSGKEIVKSPVANISNSLQGRLPGLQFQQTSGEPGGDAANINIRGLGPALTIVDGVPTDINQINPNDIETISILKDGAAAIYGFRAANGAIIITTKRGNSSKPTLSFDAYSGTQANAIPYPTLLNAGQYIELQNEAAINSGSSSSLPYTKEEAQKWKEGGLNYESTDWYNLVFNEYAPQNSINLSVRGGSDNARYFISGGVLNQSGNIKSDNSNFKRYNLRSNIDFKINKDFKASINLSGRLENRNAPPYRITGNDFNILQTVARVYPSYKPYANNNPDYFGTTNVPSGNPLAMSSSNAGYNRNTWAVMNASGTLEYSLPYVKGLSAKANLNYEYVNYNSKTWNKQYSLYNYNETADMYDIVSNVNNPTTLSHNNYQEGIPIDLQLSLNYENTFAQDHNIKGLLLMHKTKKNGFGYYVNRNYSLDALDQLGKGDVLNQTLGESKNYQEAYLGYAARLNYDYKGKYLFEAIGRYDYSWKFPNNAGFFPSVSAGWIVSNESFFNVPQINNLKIKGSWAKMPDDNGFGGFIYLSGYNYPSGSYLFSSGTPVNGLRIGELANPSLTWVTGAMHNLGVEIGLWDNMITGEFNIFRRNRSGLTATRNATYPSVSGAFTPLENLNEDNTRGFEIELGLNKTINGLKLNVSPNFAYSRSMNGFQIDPPAGSAWSNYVDKRTNRWNNIGLGYVALGQFQSQEEINTSPVQDGRANHSLRPGDIKYEDINGDGVINDDDRRFISRGAFPQIQYGLNLSLEYKNFDLSALFAGAAHFNISYDGELQRPFFNGANSFDFYMDRWRHEDIYDTSSPWIKGKYPSTVAGGSDNNNKYSTFWVKNGDYLRLKNLVIGYSLPKNLLSKVGIENARIYASGQNLFILSEVKNLDPEAFANAARGAYYPIQKVYTFGVNIGF
ncbi:TonB-dependent receptor [Sphingobacterium bovistauri]|uniref:TonB-dependent receptor n=1 Tax=Sphingobacterium bovistauri TaxID=2781959 RepID=A0ABS7Z686_9SPHI|nr:TonB-dependent receptor [Sphingobacterium bovistauri]MCA5005662.1 TonB-dependent receptor [Sphingobacterium bovistauri]